jgi:hypothetical protein
MSHGERRAGALVSPAGFSMTCRTSARNLLRAGVPEHWAMRLTGHKTTEVFRRYAITSEGDLRDAVSRLCSRDP